MRRSALDEGLRLAMIADRKEREADEKLSQIFGQESSLQDMFDLEDRWKDLTGFQRRKILFKATKDEATSAVQQEVALGDLHQRGSRLLTIEQAREVVRMLREEDLDKYR